MKIWRSVIAALALLAAGSAWAAAPGVINYYNAVCDPNYPARCLAPSSSGSLTTTGLVGGYEFNASVVPTVQNAAYAAGQSLGGLQTISIGSTNSLSGILTGIRIASKGGSTVSMVVYIWSKNPTNTTCADKTNFVVSQTDNEALVAPPTTITPALGVSAQDTTTYGNAANLVWPFNNGSTNTDLYICILANAAVTPATTSDLRLNISGTKDQP